MSRATPDHIETRNRLRSARVRARVDQVLNWLLAGLSTTEIVRAVEKQHAQGKPHAGFWANPAGDCVSARTVDTYVHHANEALEAASATVRDRELGKTLLRLDGLFAKSLSVNDYARCLLHLKERNAVLGLYAPTRSEISGPAGGPIETAEAAPVNLADVLTREELETLARIRAKIDGDTEPG